MYDAVPKVVFYYSPDMYDIYAEIDPEDYLKGEISVPKHYSVPYKTVVTVDDNIVNIDYPDGTHYEFVADAAEADNQYDYSFMYWSNVEGSLVAGQGEWTDDWTVYAHFSPEPREYYVDWIIAEDSIGMGTVVTESGYYVPYGTKVTYTSGDTVTITLPDGTVKTFQAIPADPDGEKVYKVLPWTHSVATAGQGEWNKENTTWTCVAHFDYDPEKYKVTVLIDPVYWGTMTGTFVQKVEGEAYYLGEFDYDSAITIDNETGVLTVDGKTWTAKPAASTADYIYYFDFMEVTDPANADAVVADTIIVAHFVREYAVYFKVATDSYDDNGKAMGTVSTAKIFVADNTKVRLEGMPLADTVILEEFGDSVAKPIANTNQYVYTFVQWTGDDDDLKNGAKATELPAVITEPTTMWAHFKQTAIPYSVVIKYMCDGAPILKNGADIRVNSQGEWGQTYSYNYLDNPKFDDDMAAKYSLIKGYIEQPKDTTNQGETISTTIQSELTVFVFEFSKKGAYVQFHRQDNPVPNPVYETPEPYGETHYATLQAIQESDAGKVIEVLITDPTTGSSVTGDFIGAGESATYNGYTYTVNQLDKITKNGLTYDAVEIVIDGGLNVHDIESDPLVIWYQLV